MTFFKENLEVSVFRCEFNTKMQDRQSANRMLRRTPECTERKRSQTAQKMSERNGQRGNRILRRILEGKRKTMKTE